MEEQCTTYTVKAKHRPDIWVFKYALNGLLKSFDIQEGELGEKQINWLFSSNHFPYHEDQIKNWDKFITNLEVTKGDPDLSFEAFWNAYNYKIGKRKMAENAWPKMSKADKINAFLGIKSYNSYLSRNAGIAKAHASTYLNQRYYENDYKSTV